LGQKSGTAAPLPRPYVLNHPPLDSFVSFLSIKSLYRCPVEALWRLT